MYLSYSRSGDAVSPRPRPLFCEAVATPDSAVFVRNGFVVTGVPEDAFCVLCSSEFPTTRPSRSRSAGDKCVDVRVGVAILEVGRENPC